MIRIHTFYLTHCEHFLFVLQRYSEHVIGSQSNGRGSLVGKDDVISVIRSNGVVPRVGGCSHHVYMNVCMYVEPFHYYSSMQEERISAVCTCMYVCKYVCGSMALLFFYSGRNNLGRKHEEFHCSNIFFHEVRSTECT